MTTLHSIKYVLILLSIFIVFISSKFDGIGGSYLQIIGGIIGLITSIYVMVDLYKNQYRTLNNKALKYYLMILLIIGVSIYLIKNILF